MPESSLNSKSPSDVFSVTLPSFEGPLDLLLHLLKEHRIDVLDIPVSLITIKYLEYLEAMREINLDIAGEFLVMAATLIHLKSRMVLPPDAAPPGQEPTFAEAELDPRADLVRRLLEYQKYRDAASRLSQRGLLHRDVFPRRVDVGAEPLADGDLGLREVPTYKLVEALARVLKGAGPGALHEIERERFSLMDAVRGIAAVLRARPQGEHVTFERLLAHAPTRAMIIGTFLAVLELCKLKALRIFQSSDDAAIAVCEIGVGLDTVLADAPTLALKDLDRDYN